MNIETHLKKMEERLSNQIADLRKLLVAKLPQSGWVNQNVACEMINVKPRQLRTIRIHLDQQGKKVGFIRWQKGKGRTVQYHKSDLESYINNITIS